MSEPVAVRPRPPRLVIFDCDGVLVDSEMIASRVLAEMLTEVGYAVTPQDCRERFTGISFPAVVALVEADWGRALPPDFERRVRARDADAFAAKLKPVAGVAETLPRIAMPKCVASSGSPEKIRHSLTVTGLIDHFGKDLFSARSVARGKPAPDLFLYAARQMGADPHHCVVVEDAESGVRAGLAAGMTVLGFAGASHAGDEYAAGLAAAGAHVVFADMTQLPGLLAGQASSRGYSASTS